MWTRSVWLGVPVLAVSAGLLAAALPPINAARLDIILPRLWGRGEAGRMAMRSVFEGGAPLLFGAMSGWLGGGEVGLMRTFATLPNGFRQPVRSGSPTLFVTGDLDGGTPLWFTDRVAEGFANHLTVMVHGQGQTEWNECVARKYGQLMQSGSVRGLNSRSCPPIPLPPFKA